MIRLWSAFILVLSCSGYPVLKTGNNPILKVGADQLEVLLPLVGKQSVALVVNHTSLIGRTHLADTLKSRGVILKKIFAPETWLSGYG